jgi:hypothetical protein
LNLSKGQSTTFTLATEMVFYRQITLHCVPHQV